MRRVRPWLSAVARLILAGVWIAAGLAKIGDLAANGRAVAAYRLLPNDVATVVGAVQPFLEIALGVLLLLGFATRLAALVSVLLLAVFTAGVVSVWARGLRIDCGCFGNGGDLATGAQPQYFSETIRDIALIAVAGFLVFLPRSRFSLDTALLGPAVASGLPEPINATHSDSVDGGPDR